MSCPATWERMATVEYGCTLPITLICTGTSRWMTGATMTGTRSSLGFGFSFEQANVRLAATAINANFFIVVNLYRARAERRPRTNRRGLALPVHGRFQVLIRRLGCRGLCRHHCGNRPGRRPRNSEPRTRDRVPYRDAATLSAA